MTPADIADVPRTARSLWTGAQAAGWAVRATWATGTPIGKDGQPQRVTERRQTGEMTDGSPAEIGDDGEVVKKAVPPRPRIEIVTTDELLVVHSLAIRLTRGDTRLCAIWEDGSFSCALQQSPLRKLNARDLAAIIKETPA